MRTILSTSSVIQIRFETTDTWEVLKRSPNENNNNNNNNKIISDMRSVPDLKRLTCDARVSDVIQVNADTRVPAVEAVEVKHEETPVARHVVPLRRNAVRHSVSAGAQTVVERRVFHERHRPDCRSVRIIRPLRRTGDALQHTVLKNFQSPPNGTDEERMTISYRRRNFKLGFNYHRRPKYRNNFRLVLLTAILQLLTVSIGH